MKKIIIIFLGVLAVSQTLHAEEPQNPKIYYKDGLHIDSPDGSNTLLLNGRLQTRFTYNALEKTSDTDGFTINRGELRFDGTVFTKQIKYGLEFGFATKAAANTGLATLNDYYVDWSANNIVGIKFGQFRVPYLYSELVSSMKQQFPDRSLAHDNFTLSRDIGVSLHGSLLNAYFNYNIFAMNGDGANSLNSNTALLLGARFDVPIFGEYKFSESDVDFSETPNLLVGFAYAYNQKGSAIESGSIPANIKVSHATVDAIFRSHGFSLQGAGMMSKTHQGARFTNWGYNVQSGYFVIPKHFEVAARVASAMLANGIPDQYEYGTAFNYYFNQHNLKLQTDYTLLQNVRGAGLTDHRVRTQLTVVF